MTTEVSLASAFILRELGGQRRTLRLQGRALPYQPLELGGQQRAEFAWYAGSPDATAQVFGAQEDETTLEGKWKDRFIQDTSVDAPASVNGQRIASVTALIAAIDSIRMEGQLLEMTWDAYVRRGILTKFLAKLDRRQDAAWTATFQWTSKGESNARSVFSVESTVSGARASINDLVSSLEQQLRAPFAVVEQFNRDADRVLRQLQNGADAFNRVIESSVNGVATAATTGRRAVSLAANIVAQTSEMFDVTLGHTAWELHAETQNPTFGQYMTAFIFDRRVRDIARRLRSEATFVQRDIATRTQGELLASYTARAGEDLRDVSFRFYNTPNEWRRLLQFNGLFTTQLRAGQVILVPRLPRGD